MLGLGGQLTGRPALRDQQAQHLTVRARLGFQLAGIVRHEAEQLADALQIRAVPAAQAVTQAEYLADTGRRDDASISARACSAR